MPKRKYKWSDDKRKRYIKEGRGQGTDAKQMIHFSRKKYLLKNVQTQKMVLLSKLRMLNIQHQLKRSLLKFKMTVVKDTRQVFMCFSKRM